ncbi:TMEM175 family protein, partial [Mucilaginibacter gilvus]|uniref:TMEM175 family protein n=1 Tax=Mucilaginibacter gilvus TaxID=2305909 RepID=UPI0037425DD1
GQFGPECLVSLPRNGVVNLTRNHWSHSAGIRWSISAVYPVLWANLFLLFWLSLIPFVTNWVSLNHFARLPVIAYGLLLSINSFAYFLLAKLLIHHNGKESLLGKAIQNDFKGRFTLGCYAFSIMVSFYWSEAGFILYCLIACIWFIPDKRIEAIYNGVDQDNESDKGS